MDDADAAQPGGGDEPAEVAHRSPADGDDGIGAGEVGLSEDLPAERGDLDVLGLLGVGDLRNDRVESGGGEVVADGLARRAQSAGMDDEDLLRLRAEQFGQLPEESVSDEHRVPASCVDVDGGHAHGFSFVCWYFAYSSARCRPVRTSTIRLTTVDGGEFEAWTRKVATCS
ncbi:Uncharacterised protein [Mycobacteroides abscessus subsp. abscessus]|nr:Uncharacterised protein [Mycobacteroides abscessus subsp. abscessus]